MAADVLSSLLAAAPTVRPDPDWFGPGPRLMARPPERSDWRSERRALLAGMPQLARQLEGVAAPRPPEPAPSGLVAAPGWSACLPAAGLLAYLEGDARRLGAVRAHVDAVLALEEWVPPHHAHSRPLDLSAAAVIGHLALYLDLARELLPEADRARIVAAVVERGVLPFVAMCRERRADWTRADHNWATVIAGNIGLGLLAAWEHVPGPQAALAAVTERLARPLANSPADGSYEEGPGYWHYGVGECLPAIRAIQLASGGVVDLFRLPFLCHTAEYGLHVQTPDGGCFAVEDSAPRWQAGWMLAVLGRGLDRPDLLAWARLTLGTPAGGRPLQQVLYGSLAGAGRPPDPPVRAFFPDTQNAMLRSDWSVRAFFVGLHAGSNGVNHAHLDLGTFTVVAGGQHLLGDIGSWAYASDFFSRRPGGARWDYEANATLGHNALLVDGAGQDPGADRFARFDQVELQATDGLSLLSVELAGAYGGRLAGYRRHFAYFPEGIVVIADEVECGAPRHLTWCWRPAAAPAAEGDAWVWRHAGAACRLTLCGLAGVPATVSVAERTTRYADRVGAPHLFQTHLLQAEPIHAVPRFSLTAVVTAGAGAEPPAVRAEPEGEGLRLTTPIRSGRLTWRGGTLAWR